MFSLGNSGFTNFVADAFAVYDPDQQYAALQASIEVIGHQALDITGTKGVQIQDSINR